MAGSGVVGHPHEVLALLPRGELLGRPQLAVEDLFGQFGGALGVLLAQLHNEAVHLHLGDEVDDLLLVLLTENNKLTGRRRVDGHHQLVAGPLVHLIFYARARELLVVDVHYDDVAEDVEHAVEVLRIGLGDAERTLRLGQHRHVGVEHVEEGASGGGFPRLGVHHDEHLVGTARSLGEIRTLVAGSQQGDAGEQGEENFIHGVEGSGFKIQDSGFFFLFLFELSRPQAAKMSSPREARMVQVMP